MTETHGELVLKLMMIKIGQLLHTNLGHAILWDCVTDNISLTNVF